MPTKNNYNLSFTIIHFNSCIINTTSCIILHSHNILFSLQNYVIFLFIQICYSQSGLTSVRTAQLPKSAVWEDNALQPTHMILQRSQWPGPTGPWPARPSCVWSWRPSCWSPPVSCPGSSWPAGWSACPWGRWGRFGCLRAARPWGWCAPGRVPGTSPRTACPRSRPCTVAQRSYHSSARVCSRETIHEASL